MLEARVRQLAQTERTALSTAPVLDAGGTLRIFAIRRSEEETIGRMKGLSADSPPGRAAHVNGTAPYQTLIQPAAQRGSAPHRTTQMIRLRARAGQPR